MKNNYSCIHFILIVLGSCLLLSCGGEMTEDERFDIFSEKYEKTAVKFFPTEEKGNPEIEALVTKDLSEAELLRKAEFCRKYINQLASFEIENLHPENAEDYQQIFKELKGQLQEVTLAAEKN